METPRIDVVRALTAAPELRAANGQDDGLGLLNGHFSKFNEWYEVNSAWEGTFLERVAPGAFAQTIAEDRAGMKVLFDHGYDPQIGNKVLGPIRTLEEDGEGPHYEVPLFDTSYNRDLLPGLKEGVYGASFRFRVVEESWNDEPGVSDHNPKGLPERTIERTRTMEFGPVTFPASPAATAGVRSMTDEFYGRLRQRDVGAYQDAVRSAGIPDPAEEAVPMTEKLSLIIEGDATTAVTAFKEIGRAARAAQHDITAAQQAIDKALAAESDAKARLAAATDPTEQSDARSAGDGAGTPGNEGEPAAQQHQNDPAAIRHRMLQIEGILK